jgi:hypothetical protein
MGPIVRNLSRAVLVAGVAGALAASPVEARRSQEPSTTSSTKRPPGYVPAATPGAPPTTITVDFSDGPDDDHAFPGGPDNDHAFPRPPIGPRPTSGAPPADPPWIDGERVPRQSDSTSPPEEPVTGPEREQRTEPRSDRAPLGGILSRTGAQTMPLVRTGFATLALGGGLVILTRRRRQDGATR